MLVREHAVKESDAPVEDTNHPLVERLKTIDVQAQGPTNEVDLAPDGALAVPP